MMALKFGKATLVAMFKVDYWRSEMVGAKSVPG